MLSAWKEFSRGKRQKRDVQEFEFNLEDNLLELQTQLKNRTYRVSPYESFYITDPKLRHIHKASVRDRVLFQAVYRVIAPIFEKQFIYDSFSSRIDKGTHAGVDRLEKFLIKTSANCTRPVYALKLDIKKFFDSIDHEILFRLLCDRIVDKNILWLLENVIESFVTTFHPALFTAVNKAGCGLPLGNVTSQLFANIYLHQLDFFIKHTLKIKYYVRYCDDAVLLFRGKAGIEEIIFRIREFLKDRLKLELHPNKISIRKYSQGIDFLGYVLRPYHRLLRTKTKQRLLRRENEKNLQSYLGVLSHANTYALARKFVLKQF